MEATLEKLSPVLVELRVDVSSDVVKSEIDEAYNKLKRTARVRGFRPGKAPRKILAQLYAPAIHADVAKRLIDKTLQDAMLQKDVQPLSKPDIRPEELDPNTPFSFKARFEVRPEIEKVEWEGLEATKGKTDVDDAKVDEEIERLRLQHATIQPIEEDRPSKEGDVVSLKLSFEVKGEPRTEEVDAEIGKGQLLPDIEQALAGMRAGEEKHVSLKFPENHRDKEIRGKETTITIVVSEIKVRVLPELDDEFAKDCGEYEDLNGLRESLKKKLSEQLEQRVSEDLARELVRQLCDKNPVPVPPSLVQQQISASERELAQYAQMTGQRFEATPEIRQRIRDEAEGKVRAGLLMAEIAKLKSVKVGDEDLEKGYEELAAQTGKNVAKLRAEYRDRQKREMLIGMILEDKVLDLIEGAAKITNE